MAWAGGGRREGPSRRPDGGRTSGLWAGTRRQAPARPPTLLYARGAACGTRLATQDPLGDTPCLGPRRREGRQEGSVMLASNAAPRGVRLGPTAPAVAAATAAA